MNFASDNSGPAHPSILKAIIAANEGYTASYGTDDIMHDVNHKIRELFDAPKAETYLVATGTAANSLSLACICRPWETVFCHPHSHVNEDECGAPEFFTGGSKLTLINGDDAKISIENLHKAIADTGLLGVHNVQRGAVTITNATERGTVYTPEEVSEISEVARSYNMECHLDGARFANALAYLECTPAELSWQSGIDIMTLGGTKNGLLGAEAVIIFDPELAWEFELRRKRSGHLFSKHRYLSAQMRAYLECGLWLKFAAQANSAAKRLSEQLEKSPHLSVLHPVEANIIFISLPRRLHKHAVDLGANYYLFPPDQNSDGNDDEFLTARLVCNWSTTDEEVDTFLNIVTEA